MKTITNNIELLDFVIKINPNKEYFALRIKKKIRIFTNKKEFNKEAKKSQNSVNGVLTSNNYLFFKF